MAHGLIWKLSHLNSILLIVLLTVLLVHVRTSKASALACRTCRIDDDLLLQKSWVCGECGSMYSNRIEHCCFCDTSFYLNCLVATGLESRDNTDLHKSKNALLREGR